MAHRVRSEVVFGDVDMMGHVNNATYFTYFETARTEYLLHLNDARPPLGADKLDFIVAKATCEYLRALRWGEKIETIVWPSRIGSTSFTFAYAILDGSGAVAARGETVQVSYDYRKSSKMPIRAALRARLEKDLAVGPGIALPA